MKKRVIIALVLIITTMFSVPAAAVTLKSAKQQKSTISSKLAQLSKDKKRIEQERKALEAQKNSISSTQSNVSAEYKDLVSQINELEINIKETDLAIEEAQNDYDTQREMLKTRLKVMYENSNDSFLDMLVNSESLTALVEKLHYMSIISKNDKSMLNDLELAKKDVEYKKSMKLDQKENLLAQADQKKDRINTLIASRAEIDDKISASKEELKKLEDQEDSLVAESNKLASLIQSLSRKNTSYTGGSMVWPLPSSHTIVSPFGMRYHPILHKRKMHTGIDIDGDTGNSIVAANSGTVIVSRYDSGGYGNMIVIDHGGGITTLYGHCSKRLVSVGDHVRAGEVIAKVGSTGLSTGPHLHFEVRVNGVVKNPLKGYLSN